MRQGGRGEIEQSISFIKYEEMFRAYLHKQTAEHVARITGVCTRTATRYIQKGNPRRGMPPIKQRYEDAQQALMAAGAVEAMQHLRARLQQVQTMMAPIPRTLIDPLSGTYNPQFEHLATPANFAMLLGEEVKILGLLKEQEADQDRDLNRKIDLQDPRARMVLVQTMKQMQQKTVRSTIFNVLQALDPDGSRGLIARLGPVDRALYEEAILERQRQESQESAGELADPAEIVP